MDINKEQLICAYNSGDYNLFFKRAEEITSFLLNRKYYTLNEEVKRDLLQDCMESLWEKHLENKIDTTKGDLMSFIWKNSTYKILDYLKKKKRRDGIIYFYSYDEIITNIAYLKKTGEIDESYE